MEGTTKVTKSSNVYFDDFEAKIDLAILLSMLIAEENSTSSQNEKLPECSGSIVLVVVVTIEVTLVSIVVVVLSVDASVVGRGAHGSGVLESTR